MIRILQEVGTESKMLYISTGSRLAVRESDFIDDWYVAHSPRNDSPNAEGTWDEWVLLAYRIIDEDKKRIKNEVSNG